MSASFTTVTKGLPWQTMHTVPFSVLPENPTLLDEIYLASKERFDLVLGEGLVDMFFFKGNTLQGDCGFGMSIWGLIQYLLLISVSDYVDYINGPLNGDQSNFLHFDFDTFCSAAGLNPAGFRRVREWDGISAPTYEYGATQVGDIIGPWIFEDIQKGLSALRWTSEIVSGLTSSRSAGGGSLFSCEHARDTQASTWAISNWSGDVASSRIYSFLIWLNDGPYWSFDANRNRGKAKISGLFTGVPHTADVYLLPQQLYQYMWLTYRDIDELGMIQNKLWFLEAFSSSQNSSHTTAYVGNISSNPIDLSGYGCPLSTCIREAIVCNNGYWLLKWNFTNQNA